MSPSQRIWSPTDRLTLFGEQCSSSPTQDRLGHILIWNVGHPAAARASNQAEWLAAQDADGIVLTETCENEGCAVLQERLADNGYVILVSLPTTGEYGAMVASRCRMEQSVFSNQLAYLPFRVAAAYFPQERVELVGVYVPSRDAGSIKVDRKKRFLESLSYALTVNHISSERIVCGDLNVVPRSHTPRYPFFQQWEYEFLDRLTTLRYVDSFLISDANRQDYSWVGRTGDGYRYDYCFVTAGLADRVVDCSFDHSVRRPGLSDHSALRVRLRRW